jgi:hypothetical protein
LNLQITNDKAAKDKDSGHFVKQLTADQYAIDNRQKTISHQQYVTYNKYKKGARKFSLLSSFCILLLPIAD